MDTTWQTYNCWGAANTYGTPCDIPGLVRHRGHQCPLPFLVCVSLAFQHCLKRCASTARGVADPAAVGCRPPGAQGLLCEAKCPRIPTRARHCFGPCNWSSGRNEFGCSQITGRSPPGPTAQVRTRFHLAASPCRSMSQGEVKGRGVRLCEGGGEGFDGHQARCSAAPPPRVCSPAWCGLLSTAQPTWC